MPLRLRPLRVDEEAEAQAAHAEMAGDGFAFLLFRERPARWSDYLQASEATRRGTHVPEGMVPATFLAADVGGRLVGRVSIRHELKDWLARIGGHIGYAVRPADRRQGYATEILCRALRRRVAGHRSGRRTVRRPRAEAPLLIRVAQLV